MQLAAFHPPLFAFKVPAGFPSPADDYIDKRLDLNELLVPRPAATLFYWVQDLAMDKSTFWPGDILIVDRSSTATTGRIVLVRMNGETLVRRLEVTGKTGRLVADNPDFPTIQLKEGLDYRILGVVRHRIHAV
jgi:DNA polymerase V